MGIEGKKISVIVPIYQVEKYLAECIESIIGQTYQNLEIILVDDGSSDGSGRIADEYAQKDQRIQVIHKENGGLASARNAGMDIATGDYFIFIDSDDFVPANAYELLLKKAEEKQADYVIGNYINCHEDSELWQKPIFSLEKYQEFQLDIKDYQDSFYIMNSSACNKIFRKEFIENLGLRFVTGVPAEDAIFTTYCFIKAKRVFYIPDIIYIYRQRIAGTSISMNCTEKYFKGISKAYKMIYDNFKENNELGFYRFFYAKSMTYMLYKFIDSGLLTEEEKIEVLSDMRWFYKLSKDLNVPACQESLELIINKIINGDYKDVIDICKVIAEVRTFMPNDIKEKMSKPQPEMYIKMMSNEKI
ncbi:MAG: glycosyltransferase [Clostridia bacterium]|nr:glycosyltransferase [Clostridia bacterium]